jgi:hypothetical protein
MVLPMARPWKHPKTGNYWVRKGVPHDLRALVGKREEKRSLGRKDPEEAKRRHAQALSEIDQRWANLRAGEQELFEQAAHQLAERVFDNWIAMHEANPSEQLLWQTEWYDQLWRGPSYPALTDQQDANDDIPIDVIVVSAMRRFCFEQADLGLLELGLRVDDYSRDRLARAVGDALQRASLVLARLSEGYDDPRSSLPSSHQRSAGPAHQIGGGATQSSNQQVRSRISWSVGG